MLRFQKHFSLIPVRRRFPNTQVVSTPSPILWDNVVNGQLLVRSSHQDLLVNAATHKTQEQTGNTDWAGMIIPNQLIQNDREALVHDSNESETGCRNLVTAVPTAVPNASSNDTTKQEQSNTSRGKTGAFSRPHVKTRISRILLPYEQRATWEASQASWYKGRGHFSF